MYAQEEEKKQYLPEEGDFAVSFNVAPVLRYVGNLFNGATDNPLNNLGGEPVASNIEDWRNDLNPDVSIMGKYMLTDQIGLRANIGLLFRNNYANSYVQDDKAVSLNPFDESELIDSRREGRNGASIMLGAEYRIGRRRVQGVFGAGVVGGFQSLKTTYKYANQITEINQNPSSGFDAKTASGYRILTDYSDVDYIVGLSVSAGVEWFIAPKVSLGAEVSLLGYYMFGGQTYQESEGYNAITKQIETRIDTVSPGDNAFYVGTDNIGGSLFVAFYF